MIPLYKRHVEPGGVIMKVGCQKSAFHTKLRRMGMLTRGRSYPYQLSLPGIHNHLACHRTEQTAGGYCPVGIPPPFPHVFGNGSGGTNIHTGSAKLTSGLRLGFSKCSTHQGGIPPFHQGEHMAVPFFITYSHTSAAKDTEVVVQAVKRIIPNGRYTSVMDGEFHMFQFQVIDQFLQFTIPVAGAEITTCDGVHFPGAVHEIAALFVILAY
jgi:hypothetical protein